MIWSKNFYWAHFHLTEKKKQQHGTFSFHFSISLALYFLQLTFWVGDTNLICFLWHPLLRFPRRSNTSVSPSLPPLLSLETVSREQSHRSPLFCFTLPWPKLFWTGAALLSVMEVLFAGQRVRKSEPRQTHTKGQDTLRHRVPLTVSLSTQRGPGPI